MYGVETELIHFSIIVHYVCIVDPTETTHNFLSCILQPRNDMIPSLDVMKEYLGLIFACPDVVHVIKGAAAKVHECDKMKEEGRIDVSQRLRTFNYSGFCYLSQVSLVPRPSWVKA